MLVDSQPAAPGATAEVAVVYADGSLSLVSITKANSQQPLEVTKVLDPSDQGSRDVAATAVDAASSRLAVVLRGAGGAASALIHSLQVSWQLL
jgi:ABC-type transporter Mla subunit MlaD